MSLHSHARLPVSRTKLAVLFLVSGASAAHASFLNDQYLDPTQFGLTTHYSAWNHFSSPSYKFYATNGYANYPTTAAYYGNYTSASAANVTYPGPLPWSHSQGIWETSDPYAFWDPRNPTITQSGASAFIATNGIYSNSGVTTFSLKDTTDFDLGTIVFQFQTMGTPVDYSSILLKYTDGTGTHTLAANELIREYVGGGTAYGGLDTKVALQWKLTGSQIRTYEIVWQAAGSSMSFVQALLDTSASYATVVPASGKWTGGSGLWSKPSLWTQNAANGNFLPHENGNVTFNNAATATVDLDAPHTIGNIVYDTAANTTIASAGNNLLTANTGVVTTSQATGTYTISANYKMNALNLFDIEAGKVVMSGVISGSYGLVKDGAGTLELTGSNQFTGGVGVSGGTLRIAGINTYTGGTAVNVGNLIVAANAGTTGALGSSTSPISIGASSDLYSGNLPAGLFIDGNYSVSRLIAFSGGSFLKTLGAMNAPAGATFTEGVFFGTSSNVRYNTAAATDKLIFTGGMSGGNAAGKVLIDGPGTVIYGGTNKNYAYATATEIAEGTLKIDTNAALTGNGNVTVGPGTQLIVQGSISGTGSLVVNGGTIGGSGTINRPFALDTGDVISPGNSPGTLNTVSETWGGGATLKLEINDSDAGPGTGWDNVNIMGTLTLTATSSSKFRLELYSLTALNEAGLIADFNANTSRSWQFLTASGGISGFDANAFEIDLSHFQNPLSGSLSQFSVSMSGNSLTVQYLAVPEPSSSMLLLGGLGFSLNRRRCAARHR